MPRYAIVENGVVTNVAVGLAPLADNWIESATALKGDTYDGASFTRPPAAPAVPQRVSRYQFAIALRRMGVIDGSEAKAFAGGSALPAVAVSAIADHTSDTDERDELEAKALGATTVRRDDALVALLGGHPNIALTPAQQDDLFILAATIT